MVYFSASYDLEILYSWEFRLPGQLETRDLTESIGLHHWLRYEIYGLQEFALTHHSSICNLKLYHFQPTDHASFALTAGSDISFHLGLYGCVLVLLPLVLSSHGQLSFDSTQLFARVAGIPICGNVACQFLVLPVLSYS